MKILKYSFNTKGLLSQAFFSFSKQKVNDPLKQSEAGSRQPSKALLMSSLEIVSEIRNSVMCMNLKDKKIASDRLNHAQQLGISYIKNKNEMERTNEGSIDVMMSLMLSLSLCQTNKSVIKIIEEVFYKYFEKLQILQRHASSSQQQGDDQQYKVFLEVMNTISHSDKFSFEFVQHLTQFYEKLLEINKIPPSDKIKLINLFFSKGLVPPCLKSMEFSFKEESNLQNLVDIAWIYSFINREISQELIDSIEDKIMSLSSLKKMHRSIQYKLKEISLSSDLKNLNPYIKQLDEFVTEPFATSLIQEDLAIILQVLQMSFKQEVRIDPYTVDFVIDLPIQNNSKLVLEMNGPSHYPFWESKDIMTAKDQLKIANLKRRGYETVSIHHTDWSAIKGVTSKMEFIQRKINEKIILINETR